MSIYNPSGKQYLRCTKRLDNKSCPGCGKIITSELEAVVYQQMVKKLASYKTLTGKKKAAKANPKINDGFGKPYVPASSLSRLSAYLRNTS